MRSILTVGQSEVIGDNSDRARLKVVAVDLVAKAWRWTEILQEAVEGVGKVQLSVEGVNDDVVERVELATEIVVEQDLDRQFLVLAEWTSLNLPVVLNGSSGFIRNIVEVMSAP